MLQARFDSVPQLRVWKVALRVRRCIALSSNRLRMIRLTPSPRSFFLSDARILGTLSITSILPLLDSDTFSESSTFETPTQLSWTVSKSTFTRVRPTSSSSLDPTRLRPRVSSIFPLVTTSSFDSSRTSADTSSFPRRSRNPIQLSIRPHLPA